MGNGILAQGNLLHRLPRGFRCFANGFGNFVRLAEPDSNRSIMVAGHNQCAEAESPPTFDHFGATIDEDHFLGGIALRCRSFIGLTLLSPTLVLLCHELKFQAAGARCIGQSFYLSVILKSTAIENNRVGFLRQETFGNRLPYHLRGGPVRRDL